LAFTDVLNSYILPAVLFICGLYFGLKIRLQRILSPKRFFRTLADTAGTDGVSSAKAVCTALAGTLGVGNIAGVATAICAGGAGAVMWMWIGSLFSMSVKYGEVVLAVKYRRKTEDGYVGGTMYTIRDGLSKFTGGSFSSILSVIFAIFCIANSILMGNILQTNAASSVFDIHPVIICTVLAVMICVVATCNAKALCNITFALIPVLSAVYIILSLAVIVRDIGSLPKIISDICREAFSLRSAIGGAAGHTMISAMRYGVTRGIFSNEAGCGTSPTAHAAADTKSAHHQGCFGILEVIVDTPVLCTMTAFVILIAKEKFPTVIIGLDGVPLCLTAFEELIGTWAYYAVGVSVILFAAATVIAQLFYGKVAVCYLTKSSVVTYAFGIVSALCAVLGGFIPDKLMWGAADIIVALMTCMNVYVLLTMRKEITKTALEHTN